MDVHREALPTQTERLLPSLAVLPSLTQFYLAGGTGLALELGHRISGDLDFFSKEPFEEAPLIEKLSRFPEFRLEKKGEQSVLASALGVKLSFLGYPYPLLFPTQDALGLCVADLRDIACMKIDAVGSRGAKRDFIDLYWIFRTTLTLQEALQLFEKKYASLRYNMMHMKKSLIYFEDAESDPMPQMLMATSWDEVKAFFEREIKRLL